MRRALRSPWTPAAFSVGNDSEGFKEVRRDRLERIQTGPATLADVTAEERIQRLEHSVNQLISEIERLPADVLYRPPSEGEWPVMSTLAPPGRATAVLGAPGLGNRRKAERAVRPDLDDPDRVGAVRDTARIRSR